MIRLLLPSVIALLISHALAAQQPMNDTLSDKTILIDSITVTALGMQNLKRAIGYSVSTVHSGELYQDAINPVSSLQGKVAGLTISGTDGGIFGRQKIQLRGASILGKNNQPLIIVDGIVLHTRPLEGNTYWYWSNNDYGDELNNINTSDIECISVLKGAAASALYGSRGMNGALVITTKNANHRQGTGVTISQSLGFDLVTGTPHLQTVYGPGSIAGDIDYGERNILGSFYRWDTGQFYLNAGGMPTLIGANGMGWGPRYDGRDVIYYDGTTGEYSPHKNSYRNFYNAGFNSNTNVIVRGGNERTSFYLSTGYRYADGTLPSTSFSRGSVLLKGSHQLNERITVEAQVALSRSQPQNPLPGLGEYFISRQVNQLYDSRYYHDKYKGTSGGIASADYGDEYANVPMKSFWWRLYENNYEQCDQSILPALNVDVHLTGWLDFKVEGNANYYTTRRKSEELGQGYANEGNDDTSGGRYELYETESDEESLAAAFFLKKSIKDFDFGGFVRGEYRNSYANSTLNATTGGLIASGQYFIENSRNTPYIKVYTLGQKQVFSAIAAFNVAWKNQLYLETTGRNDWSSSLVYSNGQGNYSYFYPSVSVSWIATETFRLPEWISYGKFRLSWAQVGGDAEPFVINPGFEQTRYLQTDGSYIYGQHVPSKLYGDGSYLKPERKNAWEAGAGWAFLKNRISVDLTMYKENTRDQIMNITLPKESGVATQLVNSGNIQNKGIEISLNAILIRNNNWGWSLDLTYAKNQNKIVELHPNVQDYILLDGGLGTGTDRVAAVAIAGSSYGLIVSDIMPERDANNNVVLTWADEYRAAYPQRSSKAGIVGNMTPDFTGSVASELKYKNLSLRVLFDIRAGGMIASYSNRYGLAYGLTDNSLQYRDSQSGGVIWTSLYADTYGQLFSDGVIPEGVFGQGIRVTTPSGQQVDVSGMSFREAYEKGYVEPVHASDYHYWRNSWSAGTVNNNWVHEVDYVALREISLAYRLSEKMVSHVKAKGINFMLTARNLGYLYNSLPNGLHPESLIGTTTAEFRERGFIPYTATFMGTVTLDF